MTRGALAALILISLKTFGSGNENWGYWWLVKLPAVDAQSTQFNQAEPARPDTSVSRPRKPSVILEAQRMSPIKAQYKSNLRRIPHTERLNIQGFDKKGDLVFRAAVKDPRILRMETVDADGNLIDYGTIRRGSAVVSIPVPEKLVIRLEIFSHQAKDNVGKKAALVPVGQVRIQ